MTEEPKEVLKPTIIKHLKDMGKSELLEVITDLKIEVDALSQKLGKIHMIYISIIPAVAVLCLLGFLIF